MIEEKTISLKKQMWELEEIPDRVNLMKDWYKDETCYIVTAGPSLRNFEKEWLRERLKNNNYKYPDNQTPWQEISRKFTGQLSEGACLNLEESYFDIANSKGIPRDSH